jgi:hypothetical protein
MGKPLTMTFLIAMMSLGLVLATTSARAQNGTVIASDHFDRPDELPFAVGGNWGRVIAGSYDGYSRLAGSHVENGPNEGIYYWQGPGTFSGTRQFARQRVVQKDGELGLVLLGGPDQAIMVGWGPPGVGNTVYIYWYSGGLDRGQLATGTSTLNNGDIIEAVLDGGVIYAKVNGVTVRSVANTTTLTSGTPGFVTYGDVNQPGQVAILDDWEAGLPQSYAIGGTITENAAGLGGVLVTASGGFAGSATTDGTGAYSIPGVPPGATSIVLSPTLSAHTMSPLARTVAGPVTGDVTGQDFTSTPNTDAVLTVHANHGSVTKEPDQATYTLGTNVTLTPVPDEGHVFADWSGDVPAGHTTDNPLHLTMDQDRTVTARFETPNLVASDDFNRADETPLAVGGNWQVPFPGGTANLAGQHVAGAAGEALYYWQGPGTFNSALQFARARVISAGGQVGLVLLGGTNQALVTAWKAGTLYIYWYTGGAYVGNLTTVPSAVQDGDLIEALLDAGTVYAKINGVVVASVANTTSLASGRPGFETFLTGGMLDDWEAGTSPSFAISGTITENALGLGGVLVTASGGFAGSATTDGNGAYSITGVPPGATSIVVTPTLSAHTMSPLTQTIAGPVTESVTGVNFTSTMNSIAVLTVLASHGSVTKNPDQPAYDIGTQVTLTPVPDEGYVFASWSGDVPAGQVADDPLQLIMDQDRTLTAHFVLPSVIASDDFNRADETPFAVGGNWQSPFPGGTANLTDQQVAGAADEALYYWQGPGTFDNAQQYARAKVISASGQVGLVLLGGTNQALVTAWKSGTLYIYWYTGGNYVGNLTTLSSTLQDGDVIEAQLDAGTVYARINGVLVASVANTTTLSAGRPGFETFLTGGVLDNWLAGTLPPPAQVEILASAGPGGTITPSGTVRLNLGASQLFTIVPNPRHRVDSLYVDGAPVPPSNSYAFTNVQANHTIHATFSIPIQDVGVETDGPPTAFALSSVWPNPVRGSTRVQIALPHEASVHVGLHDVQGRELQVLAHGVFPAGRHPVQWSNARGSRLHPGLYFIRMTVPGHTMVRRFVLVE